jgi:hypothetical protein
MSNLAEIEFCDQLQLNLTSNSTKLRLKLTIWSHFDENIWKIRPNSTNWPISTIFDQIRQLNLVEFKFKDQIWPLIQNLNSTFLVEFRIISSQVQNLAVHYFSLYRDLWFKLRPCETTFVSVRPYRVEWRVQLASNEYNSRNTKTTIKLVI